MLDLAKEGLIDTLRNKGFRITELSEKDLDDLSELRALIETHLRFTRSDRAAVLLQNWDSTIAQFRKVISKEYKQMLAEDAAAVMAK